MSNLVVVENKSPLLLALQDDKLFSMPDDEVFKFVAGIATRTKHEAGQSWDKDGKDLSTFTFSAIAELKALFPQVTKSELDMLCSKGVRGEYGVYMGINIVTLNNWIKAFIMSPERRNLKRELREKEAMEKEEADKQKNLANSESEYVKIIKERFKEYKETGKITSTGAGALYDYLTEKGIMPVPSKEKKLEHWDKGRQVVIENLKRSRVKDGTNSYMRQEIARILERVTAKMENQSDKGSIKVEAKLLAIKDFYDSISDLKI